MELTKAAADVLAERLRQIEAEGWTPEHDDEHSRGEMADAAGCYALIASIPLESRPRSVPMFWPIAWHRDWWKPSTPRRDLVKAAALILAEIERLDRMTQTMKRKAPYPDFAGNCIHEGDTIAHPSGEIGRVVFLSAEKEPEDQWRVDYGVAGLSRLCLQVDDKGRAVVTPND